MIPDGGASRFSHFVNLRRRGMPLSLSLTDVMEFQTPANGKIKHSFSAQKAMVYNECCTFGTRVLHFSGTVFSICLHGLTYCINRLSFPVRASNSSQHQPLDVFAYHLDAFLVLAALRDYYVGVAFGWLDKLLMHGLEHVEIAV